MYLYAFCYLNVIDQRHFNIHLYNKSATGICFCKNLQFNNVLRQNSIILYCFGLMEGILKKKKKNKLGFIISSSHYETEVWL